MFFVISINFVLGMSETREQILEEIKIQGDLVRKLKAAKEPKEKVRPGLGQSWRRLTCKKKRPATACSF